MPPFQSYDGLVRTLKHDPFPTIEIPDTIEKMWPAPVPVVEPAKTPPDTKRSLLPIPPAPEVEERRSCLDYFASVDFVRWELLALKYGVPTAVVGVVVYELYLAVLWLYTEVLMLATNGVGLVVAGGLMFLLWRLAGRLSHSDGVPAMRRAANTVTAAAHPLKTTVKLVKGEPVRTAGPEEPVRERARLWTRRESVSAPAAKSTGDPLVDGWIADMRNPAHKQTTHEFWGDDDHGDTFCAVGWLLRRDDPDGFGKGWGRVPHRSYRSMCRRLGTGFVKGVERMNDSGRYSLPDLADYVEKKKVR